MKTVLAGLNCKICLIYLDGIIVIGRDFGDMIKELRYCSIKTLLQLVSGTVCGSKMSLPVTIV